MKRLFGSAAADAQAPLTALALVLVVLLWLVFPKVYAFSDPVMYLELANDFSSFAEWQFNHPFENRLLLNFSHWVSYSAFGVSVLSSFLPQLLLYLVLVVVVLSQCETPTSKIFAVVGLLLLFPQSLTVFPDLGVATFMFLSVVVLKKRQGWRRGLVFSLLAFSAFLFKLTAVFLIVPYAIACLRDSFSESDGSKGAYLFHAGVLVTMLLLTSIYLVVMLLLSGDPLARLSTANSFGDEHLWQLRNIGDAIQRLLVQSPIFFSNYLGIILFLCLIGSVFFIFEGGNQKQISEYLVVSIFLFLFASSSLSTYNPLPLFERMVAFIVPPAVVVAANFIPILVGRVATGEVAQKGMTIVFFGFALHWSFLAMVDEYVRNSQSIHHARAEAAEIMEDREDAILLLAEERTFGMLGIHLGFNTDFQDRSFACLADFNFVADTNYVVLIDAYMARFLSGAYGDETCARELKAWAISNNLEVVSEADHYFFAVSEALSPLVN